MKVSRWWKRTNDTKIVSYNRACTKREQVGLRQGSLKVNGDKHQDSEHSKRKDRSHKEG